MPPAPGGRARTVRAVSPRKAPAVAPGGPVPVGTVEIAALLGVARHTVDQWRYRGLLPEPRWVVGGRPAWDLDDIDYWARSTGRL